MTDTSFLVFGSQNNFKSVGNPQDDNRPASKTIASKTVVYEGE